ncbi:zf-AD domain containing protein, partial [Asbolus verrucosus]
TCVNTEENVVKIKNTFINCESDTIPILDVLNLFSDVKINENYPDSICSNCVEKAASAYKFKVQCDQSNRIFQDITKKVISNNVALKADNLVDIKSELNSENNNNANVSRKPRKKLKLAKTDKSEKKDGPEKLLFCNQCNKSFKNKYILSAHVKRHQYKGHFLCNVCGKGFNSQSCLTRHTRVHTGERKYECQICHKKFPSSNNLNLHSRVHSGFKPKTARLPCVWERIHSEILSQRPHKQEA